MKNHSVIALLIFVCSCMNSKSDDSLTSQKKYWDTKLNDTVFIPNQLIAVRSENQLDTQRFTIAWTNVQFGEEFIMRIRDDLGYYLFINGPAFSTQSKKPISLSVHDKTIYEILAEILKGRDDMAFCVDHMVPATHQIWCIPRPVRFREGVPIYNGEE